MELSLKANMNATEHTRGVQEPECRSGLRPEYYRI